MAEHEEEEDFTEVSYYEEVLVTDSEDEDDGDGPAIEEYRAQKPVPTPPANSEQRPVHPIVAAGAGGGPSAGQRPVNPMVAALAGGGGGPPSAGQRPVNPMVAALAGGGSGGAAPPALKPLVASGGGGSGAPVGRPPHLLMGGGGGGASLNDQIAAMAAKRNKRVAEEGTTVPEPAPKPQKPAGNSGSIADQVAEMAAKRRERMGNAIEAPVVDKAPVQAAAPVETKVALKKTPAPPLKKAVPPPKPAAVVERKSVAPQQTIPKAEPAQKPAFMQAKLRKTDNSAMMQEPVPEPTPDPVPSPVKATTNPTSKKTSTTTERVRAPGSKEVKIKTTKTVTTTDLVTKKSSVETFVTESIEGGSGPVTENSSGDGNPEAAPGVVTKRSGPKVIDREADGYTTEYNAGCVCAIL